MDKMPYFKCAKNKDGVNHSPKVTVDGKLVTVCLKGLSKDRVCINKKFTFARIFVLDKITDGVNELNTWALDMDDVTWSSPKVTAAAAKVKPTVLNENTGKDDK